MRQPLWQRAASTAARLHKDELRDDGVTPYISHPVRVAMAVRHLFGCDDDEAIAAAFLHDSIENTEEGYDELAEEFGPVVADLVVAVTKNMMLPSQERERDYEARLERADWRARLVKLADEYDNYTDVLTGVKDKAPREEMAKAERIIELAEGDAEDHPETARAIALLQKLLKQRRLK
jgi:(p)ppGpp synthase/HD superfamily hydrolase